MVNSMIYAGIDIANQTLVAAVVDSDCLIIMELFSLQTITMISSALKPSQGNRMKKNEKYVIID